MAGGTRTTTTRDEGGEEAFWARLRQEAEETARREPFMAPFLRRFALDPETLAAALAATLAHALAPAQDGMDWRGLFTEALGAPKLREQMRRDLQASAARDPACRSLLQPFFFYKGITALQLHRVAHALWTQNRTVTALGIQALASRLLQVDIHPAARLGAGLFMDHATGVVIGETSVVGEDVTILQSVTLGGNGKERGDRHPKIGNGVLVGVGAKVLGNIRVGDEARVAAGSVVLADVPAHVTVAGIPARPVRGPVPAHPAQELEHRFPLPERRE